MWSRNNSREELYSCRKDKCFFPGTLPAHFYLITLPNVNSQNPMVTFCVRLQQTQARCLFCCPILHWCSCVYDGASLMYQNTSSRHNPDMFDGCLPLTSTSQQQFPISQVTSVSLPHRLMRNVQHWICRCLSLTWTGCHSCGLEGGEKMIY